MRSFSSIAIDSEKEDRIRHIKELVTDSEAELLFLHPPKNNDGVDQTKKLLESAFWSLDDSSDWLKRYNTSDVCGFEFWYDEGEIEFFWYTPNEDQGKHYRRHLNTRYSDGQLGESLEKFPDINETEYFVGAQYYLKNHYFEPVNHHASPLSFSNIYEDLLSEIDTKDDTRVILQVLFKPAADDWTEIHSKTVDDVAEELDMSSQTEKKLFGLIEKEKQPSSEEKKIPGMIRSQKDQKGYYVNFRVGIIGSDKEQIEKEMSEVDDILNISFESASGQNFVPKRNSENELQQLLEDMVSRNPDHMFQPKTPKEYLKHKFSDVYKHVIMTATELSSIAHVPSSREVEIDGIKWSLVNADGSLPQSSMDFDEPSEEEKKQIKQELQRHSMTDVNKISSSSESEDSSEQDETKKLED